MPWQNTPEKRKRDAAVYSDPEYVRNRTLARERAAGRCECQGDCGKHDGPCRKRGVLQCDHVIPVTRHGGHELANLRMLCSGPGSCHAAKSAQEGGGFRNPRSTADPDPVQRTRW